MNNPYAAFFAAFKKSQERGNPLTRSEVILEFTSGRTGSLKDLQPYELNELTLRIRHMNPDCFQKKTIENPKSDRMRKAIIAIFHKMDKQPSQAIAWAEKQGVGGVKKRFNDYTNQELYKLILVAEKVLNDYEAALRKGMRTMVNG